MPVPSFIKQLSETVWEIPRGYKSSMTVPAHIYSTRKLMETMDEGVFEQTSNVAGMPGIIKNSLCMPDGHWGYGFPIGGVAAIDPELGVISPGGIGFDINCGMRLIRTSLTEEEIKPVLHNLVDRLFEKVPCGVGKTGFVKISRDDFCEIAEQGSRWCIRKGFAEADDIEYTEGKGCVAGADFSSISRKAIERGINQVGTLGSGNHYLEIQIARKNNIFDSETAKFFGIDTPGQVVIMLHCGSRGFGHQVATEYLDLFLSNLKKYNLKVPERELACAPFRSEDGQRYFSAMKCAINMSYVNRQVILHRIREVFSDIYHRAPEDLGIKQVYDISHNTALLEKHIIDGKEKEVLIHRKGATRAFCPGHPDLPEQYKLTGQPVIIGGSMESGSYLLAGMPTGAQTFFTTAHGSGRTMSRNKAKKLFRGDKVQKDLAAEGIYIRTATFAGLAEEVGAAYKDIDDVVDAAEKAGLSRRIVKFSPIGNIKG